MYYSRKSGSKVLGQQAFCWSLLGDHAGLVQHTVTTPDGLIPSLVLWFSFGSIPHVILWASMKERPLLPIA